MTKNISDVKIYKIGDQYIGTIVTFEEGGYAFVDHVFLFLMGWIMSIYKLWNTSEKIDTNSYNGITNIITDLNELSMIKLSINYKHYSMVENIDLILFVLE